MRDRYLLVLALVMIALCGCHKKKPADDTPRTKVEDYQPAEIVDLPAPDVKPVSDSVDAAKKDVSDSQSDVQQVLNAARASDQPLVQRAVPPLTDADTKLTSANGNLDQAKARIATLELQIKEKEDSITKAKQNYDGLKAAAEKDRKAHTAALGDKDKEIAKRDKRIADLENEAMRNARNRLFWMGTLLMLGGIGSFAAVFLLGFAAGWRLGPILAGAGAAMMALSELLPTIVYYAEVVFIVGTIGLVLWLLWEAFLHHPKKAAPIAAAAAPAPVVTVSVAPPPFPPSPAGP